MTNKLGLSTEDIECITANAIKDDTIDGKIHNTQEGQRNDLRSKIFESAGSGEFKQQQAKLLLQTKIDSLQDI